MADTNRAEANHLLRFQERCRKSSSPLTRALLKKVEIAIEKADELYREIRIENVWTTDEGEKVGLQRGAQVDVTIEAEPEDTTRNPA